MNSTASLAALVPDGQVIGVDASTGMIDAAREHAGDGNCARFFQVIRDVMT